MKERWGSGPGPLGLQPGGWQGLRWRMIRKRFTVARSADCESAIQQIKNIKNLGYDSSARIHPLAMRKRPSRPGIADRMRACRCCQAR
ncbi:hypothetical protein SBV1_2200025 [Verrucomicrobia bacterium]|nr:hypothetical protein SBV1_2200025 [Verrucomicrobiota bacterium]